MILQLWPQRTTTMILIDYQMLLHHVTYVYFPQLLFFFSPISKHLGIIMNNHVDLLELQLLYK